MKIVSGFVTLGVGLAVSTVGVAAGIIFRKYRINYKRQRYKDAEDFLENNLYEAKRDEFRELLLHNLLPSLLSKDASQINYIVKSVIAAVANLILDKRIETFEELRDHNFVEMIRDSLEIKGGFALNTKLMLSVLSELEPEQDDFDAAEVAEIIRQSPDGGADMEVSAVAKLCSTGLFAHHEGMENKTQDENVDSLSLSRR